jgi:hypothetical protein
VKKTYHIVTRAARESAAVIEQFCQTNGQILLPIVNLIQNAGDAPTGILYGCLAESLPTTLPFKITRSSSFSLSLPHYFGRRMARVSTEPESNLRRWSR